MRIDVRGGFTVDDGLRNYVGLRLMSVLDHLVRQVDGVVVSLADVPARGGEVGKRCQMVARLAPSGAAHVEETDSDLYGAIDGAAETLARAVARELAGRRRQRRLSGSREGERSGPDLRSEATGIRRE